MVIRSYSADSVASALKQVRTDMGGNAVVLKTRVTDSAEAGKMYEVTACLDKPTVEQANQTLVSQTPAVPTAVAEKPIPVPEETSIATESRLAADSFVEDTPPVEDTPVAETSPVEDTPPVEDTSRVDLTDTEPIPTPTAPIDTNRLHAMEAKLDQLLSADQLNRIGQRFVPDAVSKAVNAMQQTDMPEACINEIFDALKADLTENGIDTHSIHQALVNKFDASIDPEFDLKPGDRVLVAGPAGSGKTSLIGRLTAWLTFEKKTTVKLISLDNIKIGAMDEIASYADLLGVDEVKTADNLKDESEAETKTRDEDKVVLIDTCALPSDPDQLSELKEQVEALQPTHRLGVFSTLTRSNDIEKLAGRMTWLEPTHLAFTMTDLTDSMGGMLAGVSAMDAKIAIITNSPSGADSFKVPSATDLADLILGREADSE